MNNCKMGKQYCSDYKIECDNDNYHCIGKQKDNRLGIVIYYVAILVIVPILVFLFTHFLIIMY
jgi:hypothetical protein